MGRTLGLSIGLLVLLFGGVAAAQPTCTDAPGLPENVAVTLLPATDGPTAAPAVLELRWAPPVEARRQPANAPTTYVVEAGSASGLADLAALETGSPLTLYRTPIANGTYVVRLRARNACGTSGASPEFTVPVRGSVARGEPNPLVLLDTVNAIRERLADTAFIRVVGQVRNGWLASPASFVEVSAVFDGPEGEASTTASTFVDGTSGRVDGSGLVTDTVLMPGHTGCFALFASFPAFQITGVRLSVTAAAYGLRDVGGPVALDSVSPFPDAFGDLGLSGTVVNEGDAPAYHADVRLEVSDAQGRILDCDIAPARGSGTASSGDAPPHLEPGQRGTFTTGTETVFDDALRVRAWTAWTDQVDPTAGTPEYRRLESELRAMLDADEQDSSPQARSALRDAWRREALRLLPQQP